MALLSGPIAAATVPPDPERAGSASLWWPADQAWGVATGPDPDSTYVGGSRHRRVD